MVLPMARSKPWGTPSVIEGIMNQSQSSGLSTNESAAPRKPQVPIVIMPALPVWSMLKKVSQSIE